MHIHGYVLPRHIDLGYLMYFETLRWFGAFLCYARCCGVVEAFGVFGDIWCISGYVAYVLLFMVAGVIWDALGCLGDVGSMRRGRGLMNGYFGYLGSLPAAPSHTLQIPIVSVVGGGSECIVHTWVHNTHI